MLEKRLVYAKGSSLFVWVEEVRGNKVEVTIENTSKRAVRLRAWKRGASQDFEVVLGAEQSRTDRLKIGIRRDVEEVIDYEDDDVTPKETRTRDELDGEWSIQVTGTV